MEKKNIFLILLIVGTAFWGITFPVTKMASGNTSSATFVFYRFLGATIVMSILFAKQLKQISLVNIKRGGILAVSLTAGIFLQTHGLKYTSAAQCAFVAGTTVIILPVIKLIFYKKAVDWKIWVAAGMALTGLFVISIKGNFTVNMGDLYTMLGAIGFAFYLINVERFSDTNNSLATTIPMFAMSAVIAFIISMLDSAAVWLPESNTFWLGIAFCALFSTAYMYTVSNISQKYISAEKVVIIFLFEPVFAAIASYFLLDESLSWRLLVGGCLIFTGTLIPEIKFNNYRNAFILLRKR